MADALKNKESGQTLVEYLLLVAAASITAYVIISSRSVSGFTVNMLMQIQGAIQSITKTGEVDGGDVGFNDKKHPSSKERLKAVHQ